MKKEWLEYCNSNNYKLMISEDKESNLYELFKNKKSPIFVDVKNKRIFDLILQYDIQKKIFSDIKYEGNIFISFYHYNAIDLINFLSIKEGNTKEQLHSVYIDFLVYLSNISIDDKKIEIKYKSKKYKSINDLLNKLSIEEIIYSDMEGSLLFGGMKIKNLLEIINTTKTKEEIELAVKIMKKMVYI